MGSKSKSLLVILLSGMPDTFNFNVVVYDAVALRRWSWRNKELVESKEGWQYFAKLLEVCDVWGQPVPNRYNSWKE